MNYYWDKEMMSYKEDLEMLRRGGFTEEEVRRLSQLRRDYAKLEECRTSAEYNRLTFVRWLVATGKLSEQCA